MITDPTVRSVNLILECVRTKNKHLDLSYCLLDKIPKGLNLLTDVVVLKLRGNLLTHVSPNELPPNLVYLDLGRNHLEDDSNFEGVMPTLQHLDLRHNFYKKFELTPFPNLTYLNLSDNSLDELLYASNSTHLEIMYLENNLLNDIPDLPDSLKKLNVANNVLTGMLFPNNCTNIKYVDLSANYVDKFPWFPDSVEEVYCSDNSIHCVKHVPDSLKKLVLFRNRIKSFSAELPIELEEIDLGDNMLPYIPTLPVLIEQAIFSCNFIEDISDVPDSLKYLNLNDNRISEIPDKLQARIDAKTIEFSINDNFVENDNKNDDLDTIYTNNYTNNVAKGWAYYNNTHTTNNYFANIQAQKIKQQKLIQELYNSKYAKDDNPHFVSIRNSKHIIV